MTWRDTFRPIIRDILAEISDGRAQDAKLLDKFKEMFAATKGSGCGWQYRIWRDEIAKQRGLQTSKRKVRTKSAAEVQQWMEKHQIPLFERTRLR